MFIFVTYLVCLILAKMCRYRNWPLKFIPVWADTGLLLGRNIFTFVIKSCIGRYRNVTSKYWLLNYSVRAFTGFNMQYLIIFMHLSVRYRNISRNLMQKLCIVLFYFYKIVYLMMAISTYLIFPNNLPSWPVGIVQLWHKQSH